MLDVSSSNILYRGEARDFEHAMNLVIDECRHEQAMQVQLDRKLGLTPERDPKLEESLECYSVIARKCLAEYRLEYVKAMHPLFERWARDANADVRMIGEAAIKGDYSGLAL